MNTIRKKMSIHFGKGLLGSSGKRLLPIVSILVFTLHSSCNTNSQVITDLDGKLLMVEDMDGQGGMLDGNFGDIVVYDIITGARYQLTDDAYYDRHPAYSKTMKSIMFEAKKIGAYNITGLTSQSNIFSLNIKTKEIRQIDDKQLKTRFPSLVNKSNYHPVLNNAGDKILFENDSDRGIFYTRFLLYEISEDSVSLVSDSLIMALDFNWSSEDESIIYTGENTYNIKEKRNFIGMVNVGTGEKKILVNLDNSYKRLGDCYKNRLLYVNKNFDGPDETSIIILDLGNLENEEIVKLDEFKFDEIRDPVFYDETKIFFIGSNFVSKNKFDEDVYLFDISTKELKQITFTKNIKDNLSYIR